MAISKVQLTSMNIDTKFHAYLVYKPDFHGLNLIIFSWWKIENSLSCLTFVEIGWFTGWVNFRFSIMKKLWDLAHENLVNIQFYNTLCIQALCAAYKTRFLGKFFLLMPRFTTCVWPPHHQRATVIYSFKYHSKIRRPKWNKIIDTPSLLGWN